MTKIGKKILVYLLMGGGISCCTVAMEVVAKEETKEKYVSKTVVNLSWGSRKGEFGYIGEERKGWGEPFLLGGFALDSKKNIYVADSGNKRILVYDLKGKLISELNLENHVSTIEWISIDRKDNLYIADNIEKYIVIFDKERRFIKKLSGFNFVRTDALKKALILGNRKYTIYDIENDSFRQIILPFIEFDSEGNYYQIIYGTLDRRIGKYDPNGQLIKEIIPPIPIYSLCGIDGFGNFYCSKKSSDAEMEKRGISLEIIKFDSNWNVISMIELKRFAIEYKLIIDEDGSIYVMSHRGPPSQESLRKEGFKIIKYEPVKPK